MDDGTGCGGGGKVVLPFVFGVDFVLFVFSCSENHVTRLTYYYYDMRVLDSDQKRRWGIDRPTRDGKHE